MPTAKLLTILVLTALTPPPLSAAEETPSPQKLLTSRQWERGLESLPYKQPHGGAVVLKTDHHDYDALNHKQQKLWAQLLFLGREALAPKNKNYYLTDNTSPQFLAQEFASVVQLLESPNNHTGPAAYAPWCTFPARFYFVAKQLGQALAPAFFQGCGDYLALPNLDKSVLVYLSSKREPKGSRGAIAHSTLGVEFSDHSNNNRRTISFEFNPTSKKQGFSRIFSLLNATAELKVEQLPVFDPQAGFYNGNYQLRRINLSAEQAYFLMLLGQESRHGEFPFSLLTGTCHSYWNFLIHNALGQMKPRIGWLADYLGQALFSLERQTTADGQPLLETLYTVPSAKDRLRAYAEQLTWPERKQLSEFNDSLLLKKDYWQQSSPALQNAIAGAVLKRTRALEKGSHGARQLWDHFLESRRQAGHDRVITPNPNEGYAPVNLASSITIKHLENGEQASQYLNIDIFDSTAGRLTGLATNHFSLGTVGLSFYEGRLYFDNFGFTREQAVGDPCCGQWLYKRGARRIKGLNIRIVNNADVKDYSTLKDFRLAAEVEITRGIGTDQATGWSWQLLPTLTALSYGDFAELSLRTGTEWRSNRFSAALEYKADLYAPTTRRLDHDAKVQLQWASSIRSVWTLAAEHHDDFRDTWSIAYEYAF